MIRFSLKFKPCAALARVLLMLTRHSVNGLSLFLINAAWKVFLFNIFVVSITGNLSQYVKQEDFPSRIYQEQRQTIDRMSCQHEQYPCKGCTRLELKRETYHCDGPSQNRPSA